MFCETRYTTVLYAQPVVAFTRGIEPRSGVGLTWVRGGSDAPFVYPPKKKYGALLAQNALKRLPHCTFRYTFW